MNHVEIIIDYAIDGTDFQYSDNHGILVRCRDCEYYWSEYMTCTRREMNQARATAIPVTENFYCGYGTRRAKDDSTGGKGEMMDELISRREAIKVVRASCHWDYPWASKSPKDIMSDAVNALKELPSAQPERKTGRWICGDTGLMVTEYKCSECGRTVRDDTEYDVYKDYPYCHCGAKMEKKNEVYANEWLGL